MDIGLMDRDSGFEKAMKEGDSGFEKAMKEGYVTICVTKCAISGPPGAGKSNLRSLILKEKRPEKYHSTPVATEATHATPDFFPSFQEDMVEAGQDDWIIVDNAKMKQFMVSWLEAPKYQKVVQDNTQTKTSEENETAGQATQQLSNPIEIKVRIRKELQQLRKNPHHKPDRLAIMRFVYLVDTGGQPQFHEVLPMFVRNTSVNMFVFKLSEKLSDRPFFKYFINGKSYCEPKKLQLTNKELIEHAAHSVFSCSQSREIKHVKRKPTHPDIALVGTFKDEYKEDSETMEEKQQILLQCLDPCIKRDGIIHASNEMVIFDIDGSKTGWSKNDTMLRSLRKKIIGRKTTWMEIDVPIRWFAFQLELKDHAKQNNLNFVMLTVCYEIGQQLDMNHEDVDQVLLFLDEVNIILYYPTILPEVVFCNPQFLLQKVTEIIVASFESYDSLSFKSYQDFYKQGIFHTELISEFKAGYKPGEFSQNDLLLLLKELLIIAKVEEDRYFMPCVLPVEQRNSDARRKLIAKSAFAPLVFSFNGYSPRGLYCALIVYLTSHSQAGTDVWNITLTDYDLEQKRNLIEFHMQTSTEDSIGTVLIEDMPSFVVVYAFGCEPKYCQKIRLTVYTAVLHATEKLHYDHKKIECKVGFLCDGSCGIEPEHAAVVQSDGKVKCTKNPREESKSLTKEQQPWFGVGTSTKGTLFVFFGWLVGWLFFFSTLL